MRIGTRQLLLGLTTIAAALAIPASAAASLSVAPTALDFGSAPVGGSTSRSVTLTVDCSTPVAGTCPLWTADYYYVHPAATGDFHATTECPNPLAPALTVLVDSCTINLAFRPTAAGQRTGTLSTGTLDIAGLVPGPTVSLTGAGFATIGNPKPSSFRGTDAAHRKKCKAHKRRHRAASAAKKKKKKCKKRKRRR